MTGQCQLVAIIQLPNYSITHSLGVLALGGAEFPCHTMYEEPHEPELLCSTLGVDEFVFVFIF